MEGCQIVDAESELNATAIDSLAEQHLRQPQERRGAKRKQKTVLGEGGHSSGEDETRDKKRQINRSLISTARTLRAGILGSACFLLEVQCMLHAFGDHEAPLIDTARLVKSVCHQRMAKAIEAIRAVTTMYYGAFCFADVETAFPLESKQYLRWKELKELDNSDASGLMREDDDDERNNGHDEVEVLEGELESFGNNGESWRNHTVSRLTMRNKFADRRSAVMSKAAYMHFSSCREMFYAKTYHRQKFLNFLDLRQGPCKGTDVALPLQLMEVLGYLAYDITGQIVEKALLFRAKAARAAKQCDSGALLNIPRDRKALLDCQEERTVGQLVEALMDACTTVPLSAQDIQNTL